MNKNLIKYTINVFVVFLVLLFFAEPVNAQTVTLSEFIDGRGGPEHSLSTGETITYTDEPDDSGGRDYFRMYKNQSSGNYEQFYIGSSGEIGRREDTSWAPLPGFERAHCTNGDIAVYTLGQCRNYTEGENITDDGRMWTPSTASVGNSWQTQNHTIVPINRPTVISSGDRVHCELSDLSGYPSSCLDNTLALTNFYEAGEFTFCTGITNEEDVIEIKVSAGPGTGDLFYFMRGWGLVGFEAPGFQAGLMGDGADASGCEGADSLPGPTVQNFGRRPLDEGFEIGEYECDETADDEFHPLRPYPASACDMLIPRSIPEAPTQIDKKYLTYACGTNIVMQSTEVFDPWGENNEDATTTSGSTGQEYTYNYCDDSNFDPEEGGNLTCYRTLSYNVVTDFRDSNIGILGNTQIEYNDETRANNYLSWYFAGAPQIGDHQLLDADNPEDMKRVVNYSGPVRKLLPQDHLNLIRLTIPELIGEDVHDYAIDEDQDWRISDLDELWVLRQVGAPTFPINHDLFLNAPLSSLEDIAGEAILTAPPQGVSPQGGTAPSGMFIISADPASP